MTQVVGSNAFEVRLRLANTWEDEAGELWFEGVASSTAPDRQRERMSKRAIEKMSQYAGLDLLPSHDAGALRELGVVEECWVDNDEFRVRGRLDKSNPEARRLYERVKAGKRYGLSVGGRVTSARWQLDKGTGQTIRVIDDVTLDHIALCRPGQAANPETYLSVMAKAAEAVTPSQGEQSEADSAGGFGDDVEGPSDADSWQERPNGSERLAKLGRFVLELSRSLWPACDRESEAEEGSVSEASEPWAGLEREVEGLRKQVTEVAEELRCHVEMAKASASPQAIEELAAGALAPSGDDTDAGDSGLVAGLYQGRQSLDGQERTSDHEADSWKGVL